MRGACSRPTIKRDQVLARGLTRTTTTTRVREASPLKSNSSGLLVLRGDMPNQNSLIGAATTIYGGVITSRRFHVKTSDAMMTTRRIALASLAAPLFVVVPWLLLGAFFFVSGENGLLHLRDYIPIAVAFGVSLYGLLVIACAIAGAMLQRLGRLSQRSLLIVGAVFSFSISAWVAGSALSEIGAADVAFNFALYISTSLAVFSALFYVWWWIASRPKPEHAKEKP